ncbi:hypothetical protein Egran_02306 [Elaphomyces granulatus]|uniref:Uncharacterized protein n=1 Tax=Elaphomyces granulatus TaxID=519963 RepID=A0A232M0J1_9EURO|nr:hypothetical protein Egran_02306 [Elaphomyces granulatus]
MASTSSFATSSMAHSANKSSTNFHSNFAEQKPSQDSRLSIEYDHETYLQLIAGDRAAEKTANQIYLEERARQLLLRSQDPAISDPQGDPSSTDFECAQSHDANDAYSRNARKTQKRS